ncbi:hypothetical protein R1flu_002285 [Riccia fluitans]|uniref:Uncharacterized protein n=1 Tax=Riccia fluitans TaxID=41844 RepID=A0ABD1Y5Q5_9MARC
MLSAPVILNSVGISCSVSSEICFQNGTRREFPLTRDISSLGLGKKSDAVLPHLSLPKVGSTFLWKWGGQHDLSLL